MHQLAELTPNVIRKIEIVVRGGTRTREAIKIIVSQEARHGDGEILQPTIEVSGTFDSRIESSRFARDMGMAFIVAAHYFDEWVKHATGKR